MPTSPATVIRFSNEEIAMQTTTPLIALAAAGLLTLAGCAASPSEQAFGDAVRETMAAQRIAPAPAPDEEPTGDGQRLEGVMSVYRTMVGDPQPVVRQRSVESN
jgi:hypothetical protein